METILIVDDEKNYLLVIETLLAEDGYAILPRPEAVYLKEAPCALDQNL